MKHHVAHSVSAAVLLVAAFTAAAQEKYSHLRNAAETALKDKDAGRAIELLTHALNAADASAGNKVDTYIRLAWVYAWGTGKNQFNDAAKAMEAASKIQGLKASQKAGLARSMVDYLLRASDQNRPAAVAALAPFTTDPELSAEEKADIYQLIFTTLFPTDSAKASAMLDEGLKLPCKPETRCKLLRAGCAAMMQLKTPDRDAALAYLRRIVADPEISAALKIAAQLDAGEIMTGYKKPRDAEALAEYESVMANPGATADQKASATLKMGQVRERDKTYDPDRVTDSYTRIARSTEVSATLRIEAYKRIIQTIIKRNDGAAEKVLAIYEEMEKVEGAKLGEIVVPHANYLIELGRTVEALKLYEKLDLAKENAWVFGQYAGAIAKAGQPDKAIGLYKERAMYGEAADVLMQTGRKDEAIRLLVEQASRAGGERYIAKLMRNPAPECVRLIRNELKAVLESNPACGAQLARNALGSGAYEYVVAASPYILKASGLDQKTYCLAATEYVTALGQVNMIGDAVAFVASAATDGKITDPMYRLAFTALDSALKANDRAGASKAAQAAVEAVKATIKVDLIPEALTLAANQALMLNRREIAEGIESCRKSLYKPTPRKQSPCVFVADLPTDITGWMNSDIVKTKRNVQKLDRGAWGADIEFILATDAAMAGRSVNKDKKGVATELYTYCNADGVHVFILAFDDQAKAAAKGLVNGGSYEGYMAPGKFQPYHCFLPDVAGRNTTVPEFLTAYKNALTRRPTFVDKELQVSSKLVADNANATLLFYPWEYYYNVLPDAKGDTWQFDVFRWTDSSSWSGTESVHNRSTWGDLAFDLTPAQLLEIRRNIIYKAADAYKLALGSKWRGTGIFEFWNDPELGDVGFYDAKLKPLKARLDACLKEVSLGMDDATVNRLFLEAVPAFFNLPYIVSDMRQEYLNGSLFAQ